MNLKQEMKGAKNESIINKNGFLLGCGVCRCAGLDGRLYFCVTRNTSSMVVIPSSTF